MSISSAPGASTTEHDGIDKAIDEASAKVLTPVQRLELSRARMRVFLDKRKPAAGTSGPMSASSVGAKISEWADGFRANPVLGAVVDAVQNWWATHPLHTVSLMAGDAVEDIAVPWIRRYPLAVVGGALAAGMVVSRLKPWRWFGRRALLAGLTSQIAAQLMTHAPLEFLIDAFTKFATPKRPTPTDPPRSTDYEPVEPGAGSSASLDPASPVISPDSISVNLKTPPSPQPHFADASAAL